MKQWSQDINAVFAEKQNNFIFYIHFKLSERTAGYCIN